MGAGGGGEGFGDFMAGGFRNDVFGTTKQASAAQAAAFEQQAETRRQQDLATKYATGMNADLSSLAQMSPQEMTAYDQTLQAASSQLQQQQRMMASIDPAIMNASKQILSVLQGGQTGIGNAMGAQRNAQRAELVNSLRAQYGPGAESSSIGQKQLQSFDRDTASLGAQGQSQTLGSLMGVVNGAPNLNTGLAGLSGAGQNFGSVQNRQIGAREAGGNAYLGALMGTSQGVINSSGADQTEQLIKSGAQRAFFDNWSNSSMKFGESFGGMGMGSAGGGGGGASGGGKATRGGGSSMGGGDTFAANNFQAQPYS